MQFKYVIRIDSKLIKDAICKHIKLNNALKLTYNEYNALRQLLY